MAVSDSSHFTVDLERIDGLDPGRRDLGDAKDEQQGQKRVKEINIFTCQQAIQEETDKNGIDDTEEASDQR